jgi:hypothetical protein
MLLIIIGYALVDNLFRIPEKILNLYEFWGTKSLTGTPKAVFYLTHAAIEIAFNTDINYIYQ